jgi:hypothetical protein
MRKGCAARLWLRWSRSCVCPPAGVAANARVRAVPVLHRALPLPVIKTPGHSRTGRKTRVGLTSNSKAGLRLGRRLSIRGRRTQMPVIRVRAILVRAILPRAIRVPVIRAHTAPFGRAISVLAQLLQATLATGSISTKVFRFRSRSGFCAATRISTGCRLPTSSG